MEISFDDFYDLKKLKDELEAWAETIEILDNDKLMNVWKLKFSLIFIKSI